MTRYRAISVDDEPSAHTALRALLSQTPDIDLAASHTRPEDALEVLKAERFDLLFLDITMPSLGGLELLHALPSPPITILLTAHPEHALSAFELGVSDYLLKPVSMARLSLCLEHVRPLLAARAQGAAGAGRQIAVKVGTAHRIIDPARIIRAEAAGNFSLLIFENDQLLASESLKEIEQRLAAFGFLRVHKSHLVNIARVEAIEPLALRLEHGHAAPMGRAYRGAVEDTLKSRMLTDGRP